MGRLIVRRLLFILPTLWLVSVLIFSLAEIVPGDVGRTILGPYARPAQVSALDHQLGADRPIVVRYAHWVGGFIVGRWGDSIVLDVPIRPLVFQRLWNSIQLALVALVIIIPLSIALGVLAALKRDGPLDRSINVVGLSLTAIPEFVSGVILLVTFAVALHWFPVTAAVPPGSGIMTRLHALILPSFPLMFVLFGYISRMARAGTAEVLESAYVRTAVLKGLPRRRVILRHVLRNALLPTVTVIGAQIGWLVGGLVVIETLFNYAGIGKLMIDSAIGHDVPVLESTVLLVAAIYMLSNLTADVIVALLNPRVRTGR